MQSKAVLLIGALSLLGCSKKHDNAGDVPAAKPAAKPATPVGGAEATPPPGAPGKLNCDKVVPKDLREKYFAGFEWTDSPAPVDSIGECKFHKDKLEGSITVTCNDNMDAAMQASIDGIKKTMPEAKDAPGIGKGAVYIPGDKVGDVTLGNQMTAWDDDSNCSVHVNVPAAEDVKAVTKDMLAALPPK